MIYLDMEKDQYWKKKGKQTIIKISEILYVSPTKLKADVNFLFKTAFNKYMIINKTPITLELAINDFKDWEKIEHIKEFKYEK
jgi:hypothetical protein